MSKDKAEEKPYLQDLFEHMHNEYGLMLLQSEMQEIIDICLKQQDHNSLSTENAKLRAALSLCIGFFDILNLKDVKVSPEGALNDFFETLDEAIIKAKQLLTDNTQENEKDRK